MAIANAGRRQVPVRRAKTLLGGPGLEQAAVDSEVFRGEELVTPYLFDLATAEGDGLFAGQETISSARSMSLHVSEDFGGRTCGRSRRRDLQHLVDYAAGREEPAASGPIRESNSAELKVNGIYSLPFRSDIFGRSAFSYWDVSTFCYGNAMKASDILANVTNVVVIVGACIFLASPNGPVISHLKEWNEERQIKKSLEMLWPEIARGATPLNGDRDRPVEIVEFADYECPFCAQNHPELARFIDENPSVGIGYRHFPLPNHKSAPAAARAAICAEEQGVFERMHHHLFETSAWKVNPDWRSEAVSVDMPSPDDFVLCLENEATSARLAEDLELGRRIGLHGTPSFVGREGIHVGMIASDSLLKITAAQRSGNGSHSAE